MALLVVRSMWSLHVREDVIDSVSLSYSDRGTLIAMGGAAMHAATFAMFDNENQIELEGLVQEFKYTSPHTFILLEVKAQDGGPVARNLEGVTPSALVREGWSSKSLKAGDELEISDCAIAQRRAGGCVDPAGH